MRIVFVGSVLFSRSMLELLVSEGANIVGVITRKNSSFNADYNDISDVAIKENIPYAYVDDINGLSCITWVEQLIPDVIFCFGWSFLIKKPFLSIAPMGVIGFHPTLLPYNRGRHPLIWAKVLGLNESGTTFFFMDEGADTGDILDQKSFLIEFEDDALSLYQKMTNNATLQVKNFLPKLQSGTFTRHIQIGQGNNWRKRNSNDGSIDFRMSSVAIINLIRALTTPYAGAHCIYNGAEVKIWKAELFQTDFYNCEPGKVIGHINDAVIVKTSDGAVQLNKHDFVDLPKLNTYIR
jgi:methionyl-tRNA formyltransferase